jgi:DNA-binding GntR family transcriptional regulator
MKNENLKPPITIGETIYQYIKREVINGKFKLNQRLQEKEIAARFGVSTTPVREAFHRLSAEKYLTINTRREVIVAGATLEQIKEVFEVVRVLDAFASKKAQKNLTDIDIIELKKLTEKLGIYYKNKKIQLYDNENLKFHDKLWSASGNEFLYQSLIHFVEKTTFYRNQLISLDRYMSWLDKSYKDHLDIMKAIEKRDAEKIENICKSHWGKGFLDKK